MIGISANGLLFSDIYPGSLSDSAITVLGVLDWVKNCHEIMAEGGFSIQDHSFLGQILRGKIFIRYFKGSQIKSCFFHCEFTIFLQ